MILEKLPLLSLRMPISSHMGMKDPQKESQDIMLLWKENNSDKQLVGLSKIKTRTKITLETSMFLNKLPKNSEF